MSKDDVAKLVLAGVVVIGFFTLIGFSLFLPLAGFQIQLDDMLIGAFVVVLKDVITHYFKR